MKNLLPVLVHAWKKLPVETKLLWCYNTRKIQTTATNKSSSFLKGNITLPSKWLPLPLHARKTITRGKFWTSTTAQTWRNSKIEEMLQYSGKPSMGKAQTRSAARICGKYTQGKQKLWLLKLQCRHISSHTLLYLYFIVLSEYLIAFCLHIRNGSYNFVAEHAWN